MKIGRTLPPVASPIFLHEVWSSSKILLAGLDPVCLFTSKIKKYFKVKHCFLVSSGRAALTIILNALKILEPYKDEVIIPAFTCYSVAAAIVKSGLKIVPCDIDMNRLDFDFGSLSSLLKERYNKIISVIPVHLFGLKASVERIRNIIKKLYLNTWIIEDAAQCFGLKSNGSLLGTLGDVAFFSLGRGKSISGVGGGIIITNNDKIAYYINEIVKELPSFSVIEDFKLFLYIITLSIFMKPNFYWLPNLIPFLGLGKTVYDPSFKIKKISKFQIIVAMNWEEKLKALNKKRYIFIEFWNYYFKNKTNFFCFTDDDQQYELIRFPLRIDNDFILKDILHTSKDKGLGIVKTYPQSINNIKELKRNFKGEKFDNADYIAKHLITLPIHPFIKIEDLKSMVRLFERCQYIQR